jgi:hypothetical protein
MSVLQNRKNAQKTSGYLALYCFREVEVTIHLVSLIRALSEYRAMEGK